ncbi:glycosyltransferase family 39 protein [Streptomyces sp. Marseille-Q5077]|uniref:glycosyltransferase family 39 protein n=1 Tax=Streptomyces sp. Marseille-Q5077 TaxID=3418995 RepID=UPI003CFC5FA5
MVIGDREPRKGEREGGAAAVLAVCVPVVVMLGLALWGLDRDGMWRDEGVTFQVARRSVPEILRLVQGVDAVHALYYLLMHAVLAVHPGEIALRLPSVLGAAAAAGLIAALGVRLARPRVGLWAGLLYAVTPLVGHYAQEGRSYALVTAGAAGATLLLVRRVWWAYGVVLTVTCLLHELAAPVVCAHAVTLGVGRAPRRVWAAWGCAVAAAGVALLPLLQVSRAQAGQVGWLPVPGWGSAERLLREFAAGPTGVVFGVCVLLMVAGLGAGRVAGVALPLLVVPPGLLIAVSQVRPMYDDRYVLYALAGAPLLVAAGADRLTDLVHRVRPSGGRPSHNPSPIATPTSTKGPTTAGPPPADPRTARWRPSPAPSPSPWSSSTTFLHRQDRPGPPPRQPRPHLRLRRPASAPRRPGAVRAVHRAAGGARVSEGVPTGVGHRAAAVRAAVGDALRP